MRWLAARFSTGGLRVSRALRHARSRRFGQAGGQCLRVRPSRAFFYRILDDADRLRLCDCSSALVALDAEIKAVLGPYEPTLVADVLVAVAAKLDVSVAVCITLLAGVGISL